VRVDTEWQAKQPPVFGGDPASLKRVRLPLVGEDAKKTAPRSHTLDVLARSGSAQRLWVRAPNVERATEVMRRFSHLGVIELELDDYDGLEEAMQEGGSFEGRRLARAVAASPTQARALLAIDGSFDVVVSLTRATAPWLLSLDAPSPRLAIRQPTYERLTEAAANDVDLREFFRCFTHVVPVEGVPACVLGREPRARPRVLDAAMMDEEGRLEIFRYTRRYITEHYMTKSLRCKSCAHFDRCEGMHVSFVRAHGYGVMEPVQR